MKVTITHKPVGIRCSTNAGNVVDAVPPAPGGGKCNGLMARISLSRLEEGLGHEGYECQKCKRRVKYIAERAR